MAKEHQRGLPTAESVALNLVEQKSAMPPKIARKKCELYHRSRTDFFITSTKKKTSAELTLLAYISKTDWVEMAPLWSQKDVCH